MRVPLVKVLSLTTLTAMVASCGSGGGDAGKAVKVSASQIVFSGGNAFKLASLAGGVVDPNVTVLAENVTIDTSGNGLKSGNLQDALDKELAINLAKTLTGRTWNVTNKTSDPTYMGTTGVVTFNADGTMTLASGYFAAIGKVNGNETPANGIPCNVPQKIEYELISDGVMYVTALVQARGGSNTTSEDSVLKVVSRTSDRIVVTGSGGCGQVGSERISILTPRAEAGPIVNAPAKSLKSI
jgi:hypothetical protein